MARLSLEQRLLAFSGLELRAQWLSQKLQTEGAEESAEALNQLLESAEVAKQEAQEAALAFALCIIRLQNSAIIPELRAQAQKAGLLSLERALRWEVPRGDEALLEYPGVLPVPDYGFGREISLGERKSLARLPSRKHIDRLLTDTHPMVAQILLRNPKLTLPDVIRMAARQPAVTSVLKEIARSPRWIARNRVRHTLILNPKAPDFIGVPLIPLCTRPELSEVLSSANLPLVRRAIARELLERRPPLTEPEEWVLH